jgi:endonuclease/exonuclease/phosphatase family metal-dependent hydrolase
LSPARTRDVDETPEAYGPPSFDQRPFESGRHLVDGQEGTSMPFRIMTWNIQCLVWPSDAADRSEERADRVADALLSTPKAEQPDLVAFNELFHDDARDILSTRLSSVWPHSVPKFDQASDIFAHPSSIITQDSGLAMFSKHPLDSYTLEIPIGNPAIPTAMPAEFAKYNDAVLSDMLAAKGVALLRLRHPEHGRVVVAISHLQASYSDDEQSSPENVALSGGHVYTLAEFAAVRAKQLGGALGFFEMLMGPKESWPPTIFMGDFNIDARMPGVPTGEYADVFDVNGILDDQFRDAWPSFISIDDLGLSQSDMVTGDRSRLDVVCVSRDFGNPDFGPLQAHHMRTLHRSFSDHYAVETLLNRPSALCCPREALAVPSRELASGMNVFDLDIVDPGAYQWVFVKTPGTYTVFWSPGVEHAIYAANDLSDPWPGYDDKRNDITAMGLTALTQDWDSEGGLNSVGTVHSVPDQPFYVRVRADPALNAAFTGPCKLAIFKHTGATKATAIAIHPQRAGLNPLLPTTILKPNDECWFSAIIEAAHSGEPHTSSFTLANRTGGDAKLVLVDENGHHGPVAGGSGDLTLSYTHPGRTLIYLVLKRVQTSQIDFDIGWRTALTFLRDDNTIKPFMIRCVDETGVDFLGDDEFRFRAKADAMTAPFLSIDWDDADTGEYYPRGNLVIPPIGYLESIKIDAWEAGDITASAVWGPNIPTLPEAVLDKAYGETFQVDTGKYRLELTLGRESTRGGAAP